MSRHWDCGPSVTGKVCWKDLATGRWMHPAPVLARVRGPVCVYPPDAEAPLWIPERCVQPVDDHGMMMMMMMTWPVLSQERRVVWSLVRNPPVLMPVEIYSSFWPSMYTTNYTMGQASTHVGIEQASINVTFTLIDALCFSVIKNVPQFGPTHAGVVLVFTGTDLCGPYACMDAIPLILKGVACV